LNFVFFILLRFNYIYNSSMKNVVMDKNLEDSKILIEINDDLLDLKFSQAESKFKYINDKNNSSFKALRKQLRLIYGFNFLISICFSIGILYLFSINFNKVFKLIDYLIVGSACLISFVISLSSRNINISRFIIFVFLIPSIYFTIGNDIESSSSKNLKSFIEFQKNHHIVNYENRSIIMIEPTGLLKSNYFIEKGTNYKLISEELKSSKDLVAQKNILLDLNTDTYNNLNPNGIFKIKIKSINSIYDWHVLVQYKDIKINKQESIIDIVCINNSLKDFKINNSFILSISLDQWNKIKAGDIKTLNTQSNKDLLLNSNEYNNLKTISKPYYGTFSVNPETSFIRFISSKVNVFKGNRNSFNNSGQENIFKNSIFIKNNNQKFKVSYLMKGTKIKSLKNNLLLKNYFINGKIVLNGRKKLSNNVKIVSVNVFINNDNDVEEDNISYMIEVEEYDNNITNKILFITENLDEFITFSNIELYFIPKLSVWVSKDECKIDEEKKSDINKVEPFKIEIDKVAKKLGNILTSNDIIEFNLKYFNAPNRIQIEVINKTSNNALNFNYYWDIKTQRFVDFNYKSLTINQIREDIYFKMIKSSKIVSSSLRNLNFDRNLKKMVRSINKSPYYKLKDVYLLEIETKQTLTMYKFDSLIDMKRFADSYLSSYKDYFIDEGKLTIYLLN